MAFQTNFSFEISQEETKKSKSNHVSSTKHMYVNK